MNIVLVRAGIDQAFGGWNAPLDPDSNEYVYVPIPETAEAPPAPAHRVTFAALEPTLRAFGERHQRTLTQLGWPVALAEQAMHLDPDFACASYGDDGRRRGRGLSRLQPGDLVLFYAGFQPVRPCAQRLVYALFGQLTVQTVRRVAELTAAQRGLNAHSRRLTPEPDDIVIIGDPARSGRFERAIPIGEWRERAYRVTRPLLAAWGGLSVRNGYLQRNAAPPRMLQPTRFLAWLADQEVTLRRDNGY